MLVVDISHWQGVNAKEAGDHSSSHANAKNKSAAAMQIAAGLLSHGKPRLNASQGLALGVRIERLVLPENSVAKERLPAVFGEMADAFSIWLAKESCVIAVVTDVEADKLQPLDDSGANSETLLSMLILAFPEVRWLFGAVRGLGAEKKAAEFVSNHGVHRLFKDDGPPLFDGRGLRDWVRSRARETEKQVEYLPRRHAVAVAMDEELDYAYLHAWAAYRFGFRAGVVARKCQADQWLGNKKAPPCLVMEDLFLNFPDYSRDKGDDYGLSDLQTREKKLPALKTAPYRVVVTVGHHKKADREKHRRNRAYFREPRHRQKIWDVRKPHAGIFSFWRSSGLAKMRFDACRNWEKERAKRGKAPGFIWPPPADSKDEAAGHSSPGILVEIARHMLNRAERMLNDGVATVEQAVRGAVLASDALELLGGKTPTMSVQALALKHQFELHAECQFCGIDHHLELEERLKEIERDAEAISRWFNPGTCKKTALNIRLDVINNMVRILREYNQFDEERICLNRARHIHNTLFMLERPWGWAAWPFLRYSEWLLSSFPKFLVAIGAWVLGLWGLYSALPEAPVKDDLGPFGKVIGTFFSVDPLPEHLALSSIAVVAGLFHLGVFISMLYELLSRR